MEALPNFSLARGADSESKERKRMENEANPNLHFLNETEEKEGRKAHIGKRGERKKRQEKAAQNVCEILGFRSFFLQRQKSGEENGKKRNGRENKR